MDVGDFLKWAERVPPVYRAEAARTLARAFFDERTAEDTRHAVEAGLTILLDDASPDVRRALADALCDSPEAPRHIMLALAADQAEIAVVVLARSPVFIDEELVDIVAAADGFTVPAEEHVGRLIDFAREWDRSTPMVVHCFAGISRSTGAAFVAACALNPKRDERDIARAIRDASPTAQPNARIVGIADRLLERDGRMVRAVEDLGPGEIASEGHPFRLDLD